MPTSHPRIAVTEDPELTAAIVGARARLGGSRSKASLVRDLALRGWQELAAQDERRRDAADELIAIVEEGMLDWDAADAARRRDPADR